MPSTDSDRVAVLIDADNTSPQHAGNLLLEVAKYGVATVKRAYGDWTGNQLNGWKGKLNENAIQPMQQFAYTTGKNSTDSALIIDAMDLLYSGHVDAFALVSSDSDFTRLATRLRESGKYVIGFGLRKTPQSLVKACDRFVYLELLSTGRVGGQGGGEAGGGRDGGGSSGVEVELPDLRTLIVDAVNSTSHDDGWALLSSAANHINRSNPSFDVRAYGESKLVNLVKGQDYLDVEHPDTGPVRVRLRSNRPAKKAAAKKAATKKAAAKNPAAKNPAAKKAAAKKSAAKKAPSGRSAAEQAPARQSPTATPASTAAAPPPSAPTAEPPKVTTQTRSQRTRTT